MSTVVYINMLITLLFCLHRKTWQTESSPQSLHAILTCEFIMQLLLFQRQTRSFMGCFFFLFFLHCRCNAGKMKRVIKDGGGVPAKEEGWLPYAPVQLNTHTHTDAAVRWSKNLRICSLSLSHIISLCSCLYVCIPPLYVWSLQPYLCPLLSITNSASLC